MSILDIYKTRKFKILFKKKSYPKVGRVSEFEDFIEIALIKFKLFRSGNMQQRLRAIGGVPTPFAAPGRGGFVDYKY